MLKRQSKAGFCIEAGLLERLAVVSKKTFLPVPVLIHVAIESFLEISESEKEVRVPFVCSRKICADHGSAVAVGEGAQAVVLTSRGSGRHPRKRGGRA